MKNGFFRGHGLGNDYVVMDPKELSFSLTPPRIKAICDRNWGLGSDGILALVPSKNADFGLRIFNPDGSEAEKSGNGLRIFARYLHATGKMKKKHFTVETKGGLVTIALHVDRHGDASAVTVEMGRATFRPASLPCKLTINELIEQPIIAAGQYDPDAVRVGPRVAGSAYGRPGGIAAAPPPHHRHLCGPHSLAVSVAAGLLAW
jgi:diaminopimelate epimerase